MFPEQKPVPVTLPSWMPLGALASESIQRILRIPETQYVITLVHGTWARKEEWYQEDGSVAKSIASHLQGAVFKSFKWSGENSIIARAAAADLLRAQLLKQLEDQRYTKAKHIVVAHSHGGNVALIATSDANLAAKISGVACLGTPFLSARYCPQDAIIARGGAAFMAVLYFWVFTGLAVYRYLHESVRTSILWAFAAAGGVGLLLALGAIFANVMQRRALRLANAMPATKLTRDQLLVIRAPGDEAAVMLGLARFVSRTISWLWRRISHPLWRLAAGLLRLWDPVRRLKDGSLQRVFYPVWGLLKNLVSPPPPLYPLGGGIGRIPLGVKGPVYHKGQLIAPVGDTPVIAMIRTLMPYALVPVIAGAGQFVSNPIVQLVFLLMILLFALPAAIALFMTLVALPIAALVSLCLAPLGREIPLAGPYLDLTAEPAPPGIWLVAQMEPEKVYCDFSESGVGGLNHSEAHSDVRVHKLFARWAEDLPRPVSQTPGCAS